LSIVVDDRATGCWTWYATTYQSTGILWQFWYWHLWRSSFFD
jgi:hypothetical protein